MRERGSVTVAVMAVVLLLLLAGSAYVVATTPQRERPKPVRGGATTGPSADALDRQAQASARSGIAAARTVYADLRSFDEVDPPLLADIEPSVDFTFEPSVGPGVVSVAADDRRLGVATRSATGICWWMSVDGRTGETRAGSGLDCTGTDALSGAVLPSW